MKFFHYWNGALLLIHVIVPDWRKYWPNSKPSGCRWHPNKLTSIDVYFTKCHLMFLSCLSTSCQPKNLSLSFQFQIFSQNKSYSLFVRLNGFRDRRLHARALSRRISSSLSDNLQPRNRNSILGRIYHSSCFVWYRGFGQRVAFKKSENSQNFPISENFNFWLNCLHSFLLIKMRTIIWFLRFWLLVVIIVKGIHVHLS